MFKNLAIILFLFIFFACTNDNKVKLKNNENKINDTIVIKKNQATDINNSLSFQKIKEIEYFISIKNTKSNLKFTFSERNDGNVIIRRNFEDIFSQKINFKFNELKYVLSVAKYDFKIDSLKYIIYGTLSSSNDNYAIEDITKKYLESKNGKSNINTEDYRQISDLILNSNIVKEINESLLLYSKKVSKINIEKALMRRINSDSKETIDCMIVMEIENIK